MTLDEAFTELLNTKRIVKKIGMNTNTFANYKIRLKTGLNVSMNKKIELLEKVGYTIRIEVTPPPAGDIVAKKKADSNK